MDRRRIVGLWVALGLASSAIFAQAAQAQTAPSATPDSPSAAPDSQPAATAPPTAAPDPPTGTTTPSAPRPKVAVVVVGDPDPEASALADRVHTALASDEHVSTVASADLRAALRGAAAPSEDDGLAAVRRSRASLSDDEVADLQTLVRIGSRAGADVVAIVRRRSGAYEVVVFDVGRRAYFSGAFRDGGGERAAEDARLRRIVVARATEAFAARAGVSRPIARARSARSVSTASRARPRASRTASPTAARTSASRTRGARRGTGRPRESTSWIERTWPYFAAVGLAGAFVGLYFLGRSGGDDQESLRVRFIPSMPSGSGASP